MEIPTSAGSFQQTNINAANSSAASRRYYTPSLQLQQYANYPVIAQLTTPPNHSLSVFGTPNTTFSNPVTGRESIFINPSGSNNGTLFSFTGTTSSSTHPQRTSSSSNITIRNSTPNSNSANISVSGINKFNSSLTRNPGTTGVRQHYNNYLKQSHHPQQQHRTNMNNACNTYPHQQKPNYQLQPQSLQNQQQHLRSSAVMASPPVATSATSTHSGTNNSITTSSSHVPSSGANPQESQSGEEPPQYRIFKRGDSMTTGGMTSPTIATNPNPTKDGQRDEVKVEVAPNTSNANDSSKLENGSTDSSATHASGITNESSSGNTAPANPGTASTRGQRPVNGTPQRTPLSLINELAKYHTFSAEYHLIKEIGPPHSPTFTVELKLGDAEAYIGEGSSIKRAQLAAAEEALVKTAFSKPTPRTAPVSNRRGYGNRYGGHGPSPHGHGYPNQGTPRGGGAPFVGPNYPLLQLTALASELNQPLSFINQPMAIADPFSKSNPPARVAVHVGERVFVGEGTGFNTAKNLAVLIALKALLQLRQEKELANAPPAEEDEEATNKSPISLVHEMGMKRGMSAVYEVINESGPAHQKSFTVKCCVGDDLITEGKGATKQMAKKEASLEMITKLKEIPAPVQTSIPPIGVNSIKYIQRGITATATTRPKMKRNKTATRPTVVRDTSSQQPTSPISRLIQIAHLRKYKEPEFSVVPTEGSEAVAEAAAAPPESVRFNNRRLERFKKKPMFLIEVKIGPHVARGQGANKKSAKKAAADNALILLGYPPSSPKSADTKESQEATTPKSSNNKSPTSELNMTSARQIVPGLIVLSSSCESPTTSSTTTTPTSQSAVAQSIQKVNALPSAVSLSPHESVNKLAYLSQLLEVGVSYSDFPKKSEYLSVVSLGTSPPHVAHGIGASVEEAREAAALQLLTELASIGLDNCVNQGGTTETSPVKGASNSDTTPPGDTPNNGNGATVEPTTSGPSGDN